MYLITGLGNPGEKYTNTRHNVGFMAVDEIAQANGNAPFASGLESEIARTEIANNRLFLQKPQTFMNNSGKAVASFANFYKIQPDHIIVIHDDIDMKLGKVKIADGNSGDGGNNGIKSINATYGKKYRKLKFGIGRPEHKSQVNSHVLSDFSKDEHIYVRLCLEIIAENIELLLKDPKLFLTKYAEKQQALPG